MSYLVANPEDRFSRDEAHLSVEIFFSCTLSEWLFFCIVDKHDVLFSRSKS